MEQFYTILERIIQKYGISDEDVVNLQQALDSLTDFDEGATLVLELSNEANQAEDAN